MSTIVNYIRSLFCNHDLITSEMFYKLFNSNGTVNKQGPKVSMYCKKCGYHKSFWKY